VRGARGGISPLLLLLLLPQLWNRHFPIKPLLRMEQFLPQLWNRRFLIKPLSRLEHFLFQLWNRRFLIGRY
jgi:hypothetical protein